MLTPPPPPGTCELPSDISFGPNSRMQLSLLLLLRMLHPLHRVGPMPSPPLLHRHRFLLIAMDADVRRHPLYRKPHLLHHMQHRFPEVLWDTFACAVLQLYRIRPSSHLVILHSDPFGITNRVQRPTGCRLSV